MQLKLKHKTGAIVLSGAIAATAIGTFPVFAAEDNIEIVLTDVTAQSLDTLRGEAKIKVSVKGAGGGVTAAQTSLKFDGNLKYKSIDFLQGEDNLSNSDDGNVSLHYNVPPNGAQTNITKELKPSIVTNEQGQMTFTDDETELFIITFVGEPGETVTLSVADIFRDSYCRVDGNEIMINAVGTPITATASSVANEGVDATVKLTMDKVTAFAEASNSDYANSKITLKMTNEQNNSVISTVLNNVPIANGGHLDAASLIPTFVVKNTVLGNTTYTVELSGPGYKTYTRTGVDFSNALNLTNADFVPGDINSDGAVDSTDKTLYNELIANNEYNEYADFNRDGRVDQSDNVFGDIPDAPTVPQKMAKPTVTAGTNKITVSWSRPTEGNVTGYVLSYGTDTNNLTNIDIPNSLTTQKELSSLTAGTTYYVRICAKNDVGTGEYSDTASAVPTAPQTPAGGGSSTGGGGGSTGGGGGSSTGGGSTGGGSYTPSTPVVNNEPFTDLGNYGWAKDAIYALKDKGIISGTSDTTFSPSSNIKRGDFILILTRMMGINDSFEENFSDVPKDSYYYNAVGSAKAAGIASGDGANFMPENSITRQDLITLAYRAFLNAGYIEEATDTSILDSFSDKAYINDYALSPMASMVKAGIIQGSDNGVNPTGNATRAEVAVMCSRLLSLIK